MSTDSKNTETEQCTTPSVSERFTKEDIKNLVYEFREKELEGWDEPYHYNAECWSGMKSFVKWLNAR